MPSYSDQQITDRMGNSTDAVRRQWADTTYAKAMAGDPQALQDLENQAGIGQAGYGSATEDARNYDKMLLGRLSGGAYTPQYNQAHDGGGFLSGLGSVLKIAAPIAGALIPGIGTLGGALIGGLGSAAGGALHGDPFSLGKTLAAGAAAGIGNRALGNGLGGGSSNWGFGSTPAGGIPAMPGGAQPGNTTQSGAGVPGMPGQGAGGLLDRFGGLGSILQQYGPLALGAAGAVNQASQTAGADHLREQATGMALQDWQSRAPLRARALAMASDGSLTDPSNPYARKPAAVPAMPGGQH